jgi:hypothetical protein
LNGYTKLYASLIHSTIWREPHHVRVLWITMLAMCDAGAVVSASIPGLADAAHITLDECLDGLQRLSSPDPYSRTKDHSGRRIIEVDGGWLIINRNKYRDLVCPDHERELAAERKRRQRAVDVTVGHGMSRSVTLGHARSRSVTLGLTLSRQAEAEEETKEEKREGEAPEPAAPATRRRAKKDDNLVRRPEGWRPNESHRALARAYNLDFTLELNAFHSWTDAKGQRYADWDAGFRNHLTREHKNNCQRDGDRRARYEAADHAERKSQPLPVLPELFAPRQPRTAPPSQDRPRPAPPIQTPAKPPPRPAETDAEREERVAAAQQAAKRALAEIVAGERAAGIEATP